MLISGIALGVVAGLASGGRIQRLALLRIRWWQVLALAALVRVGAPLIGDLAAVAYVLAFVTIAAVAVANTHLPGMWLLTAGAASNCLVVAVNGGMPVDLGALAAAGAGLPGDRLHIELTDGTALAVLADRIPVSPFRGVYSIGDVLLAAAGFWMPFRSMRAAR